jgi:ABC-type transporter Mla maintaining outer membrane lipid asymmetry permease subunit MlaE
MIYFAGMALFGAFVLGRVMEGAGIDGVRSGIASAITPLDLPFFFTKGIGLGVIVGWLSCHFGLEVKSSPTEVPRMASRAVVSSLLGCVVVNTVLTGIFYYLVGPPIR